MTTVLHLTDTHIVPKTELVSGRLDTAASLSRLVARLTSCLDQIGPIDAMLISGDLSDDRSAQSYEHFKHVMAPLEIPLHVIPGNHDAREPMRTAFSDRLPQDGPLNWDVPLGDIRMIGLDTLVEGHRHGLLIPETLAYLKGRLHRAGGAPILLALHHPPFQSGIRFMDAIGLRNKDKFIETISGYSGEIRIICGHIHTMIVTSVAGNVAISGPAPASTFAFDRRQEAKVGFMTQEDGCLLHRWDEGFQTIRIGPAAGAGPYPF